MERAAMTRLTVILASAVILSGATLRGQGPADSISGTWASDGRPLLELATDGRGNVSGTIHFYEGPNKSSVSIGTGTFDARSGALKLAGQTTVPDGRTGQYVIDGVLQQGTLQVTLVFADAVKGTQVLRRAAAQAPVGPSRTAGTRTVLITGANRGLGLEFAKQYAANGWNVIATARNPETAKELQALAAAQKTITVEKLDVLDTTAIRTLATKYRGRPVDVLLNNAGVLGDMKAQALGSLDYAEFEEVMAVNVYAPLAMAEAFLEHVAASDQKKIVSLTSRSGIISLPGSRGPYFYRASKIGLNMVMRVLADDVRGRGVTVALVSPPPTETDMLRALIGPQGASRQARPANVIAALVKVIDDLTPASSESVTYFDGSTLPW